ncbi:phage DNA packaging protein J [Bacillus mojavensis]|nr:phage DNA packaging protein J [Bacillus mojavensis]
MPLTSVQTEWCRLKPWPKGKIRSGAHPVWPQPCLGTKRKRKGGRLGYVGGQQL